MFLLIITALLLYWFLVATKHPKGFPPGPKICLPVIGNLHEVGTNIVDGYRRLTDKYGKILGLYIGMDRVVIVSDFKMIEEFGNSAECSNRPELYGLTDMRGGKIRSGPGYSVPGVVMSNGKAWAEQRRFTLHTLRDLGFGKHGMEQQILEEVNELCKQIRNFQGKPVDIKEHFTFAVLNSLWTIMSGERLDQEDESMKTLFRLMNEAMKQLGNPLVRVSLIYKPIYLLTRSNILKPMLDVNAKLYNFLESMVKQHEETYQEECLRDFTDHYLKKIRDMSASPEESSFKGNDGRLNMINVLFDFFGAGTETTSHTLAWCMLYMILYPDVQEKVQDELDGVTGKSRLPCMLDRSETPFTEAVIEEIQRLSNVAPMSLPHFSTSDIKLGEYVIPKGTALLQNLGHVHRNSEIFQAPNVFDPARHLNEEGKFVSSPKMIPFGIGKRRCPGEALARMSLYLFLAGILSNFNLAKAHANDYLTTDACPGSTQAPFPFKMRFIPRN